MLLLSRWPRETICISDNIAADVFRVDGGRVQLEIDALRCVSIRRAELQLPAGDDEDGLILSQDAVTAWESEGGYCNSTTAAV